MTITHLNIYIFIVGLMLMFGTSTPKLTLQTNNASDVAFCLKINMYSKFEKTPENNIK